MITTARPAVIIFAAPKSSTTPQTHLCKAVPSWKATTAIIDGVVDTKQRSMRNGQKYHMFSEETSKAFLFRNDGKIPKALPCIYHTKIKLSLLLHHLCPESGSCKSLLKCLRSYWQVLIIIHANGINYSYFQHRIYIPPVRMHPNF